MSRELIDFTALLEAKSFMYAEMIYFEGAHFAHVAAYREHLRLRSIRLAAASIYEQDRARTLSMALANLASRLPQTLPSDGRFTETNPSP
jgi:hypothetical protein